MANPLAITAIRQAAESIVGGKLGAVFRVLPMRFRVEENDSRSLEAGYSVLWGAATESTVALDQKVCIEQDLLVLVTRKVFVRNSDTKTIDVIDEVYESIGEILCRFIQDKLDLEGTVLEVRLQSMGEPKPLENQRDIVSIELGFRVLYAIT